jgi:hypothetical protein
MKNFHLLLILVLIIAAANTRSEEIPDGNPSDEAWSNAGSNFIFTVPPAVTDDASSGNNLVKVYVASRYSTDVTLEVPAKGYKQTYFLNAGRTVEFQISPNIAQPYIKGAMDPVLTTSVFKNSAIHVKSDAPVIVYVLVDYNQTGEGYLALPVHRLGNEYVISSYNDASNFYSVNSLPSMAGIVAPFDDTEITFTYHGKAKTLTSGGLNPGESDNTVLNAGDVWMFSSIDVGGDLTGSVVTSNKPVAVISASQRANVPENNRFYNYLTEMEMPPDMWGKIYPVPLDPDRKKNPVIRVFSKEPNTNIYLNNDTAPIATLNGLGGKENEAWVELRTNDGEPQTADFISSDKPIYVVMYTPGTEEEGFPQPKGGPAQTILVPLENAMSQMSFSVPGNGNLETYDENTVTVIFEVEDGKIPAHLQLGEIKDGEVFWRKMSNIVDGFEYYSYTKDGKTFGVMTYTFSRPGSYMIKSDNPFIAYSKGNNDKNSYGFPSGTGTQSLEGHPDNEAPEAEWQFECDGSVTGKIRDLPEDADIRSNLADLWFYPGSKYSENYKKDFIGKIVPGETREVEFRLQIINPLQNAKAKFEYFDRAGNFDSLEINYTAPRYSVTPAVENFGAFKKGEWEEKEFTLTNNSGREFEFTRFDFKYGESGFSFVDLPELPLKLADGGTATFKVRFDAFDNGIHQDSIGIGDDCIFQYLAVVEATVGSPVIEVSDINFGDVTIGTNEEKSFTISNSGSADLIILGFSGPVSAELEFDGKGINPDNQLIIPPGGIENFSLVYRPGSSNVIVDSIIVNSDAEISDRVCKINARPVQPGLVAESYDWGRKLISREDFPAGPYEIDNENAGLRIFNSGTAPVTISEISIDGDDDIFELMNLNAVKNRTIEPQDEIIFRIRFSPDETGNHEMKITYIDESGNETESSLRGFGTLPRIQSSLVDFDTVVVGRGDISSRFIRIRNLSQSEWEFADTVEIYNIIPGSGIIVDAAEFGSEGFKIEPLGGLLPDEIAPGAELLISAEFMPPEEGRFEGNISTLSNAEYDLEIKLIGTGIKNDITVSGGSAETCINGIDYINAVIRNNSDNPFKVGSVQFSEIHTEFTFNDPGITAGFEVAPGKSQDILIAYSPKSQAEKQTQLVFTDGSGRTIPQRADISGRQFCTNLTSM